MVEKQPNQKEMEVFIAEAKKQLGVDLKFDQINNEKLTFDEDLLGSISTEEAKKYKKPQKEEDKAETVSEGEK